jgi:hypothetical protein
MNGDDEEEDYRDDMKQRGRCCSGSVMLEKSLNYKIELRS